MIRNVKILDEHIILGANNTAQKEIQFFGKCNFYGWSTDTHRGRNLLGGKHWHVAWVELANILTQGWQSVNGQL